MHRVFQQDLYRLRLKAARSYVHAIATSMNPLSTSLQDPVKLSAQVRAMTFHYLTWTLKISLDFLLF